MFSGYLKLPVILKNFQTLAEKQTMLSVALFLLFSEGVLARDTPRLAGAMAADEAYRAMCERKFAAFEADIARRREGENVVYDKEGRIRARHGVFRDLGEHDNGHFILLAQRANSGLPTRARLFLDLENAVLKELNDKVVKDKDLVTVLTNLHKDVLFKALQDDEVLWPLVIGRYSDFKSLRIALSEDNALLRRRLGELLARVNARYSEYVDSLSRSHQWKDRASGLAAHARNWYHGGIGSTPDQAGLATRFSRTQAGVSTLRRFSEAEPSLLRSNQELIQELDWLKGQFSGLRGIFAEGREPIVSAELIETVRKTSAASASQRMEELRRVLSLRFGQSFSASEVERMDRIVNLADQFSPGLLLAKREVIDLGEASAHGVLSADFKGQNARNIEETVRALVQSKDLSLEQRIVAVREAEARATANLDARKSRFQQVVSQLFPGRSARFSGDDGLLFLPRGLRDEDKDRFIRAWLDSGGKPEDLRLTFERFQYEDTKRLVPPLVRSQLVGQAESLEKNLRAKLLGFFTREQLNNTLIAVEWTAREQGPSSAKVRMARAGSRPFPSGWQEMVKKLGRDLGITIEEVVMVP